MLGVVVDRWSAVKFRALMDVQNSPVSNLRSLA